MTGPTVSGPRCPLRVITGADKRPRLTEGCSAPWAWPSGCPPRASRRDHYRLRDDAWALLFTNQNAVISAMLAAAETGIAATGHGSPAGRRLIQMRDFHAFLLREIPALLDRWHHQSLPPSRGT